MQGAVDALNTQNGLIAGSPMLLFDRSWKLKTAVALSILDGAGTTMQQYEPVPSRAKALDDILVSISQDINYIVAEYTAEIDGMAAGRINNASARMTAMNPKLTHAITEMQTLTGQ
jgi:hypothetical protein